MNFKQDSKFNDIKVQYTASGAVWYTEDSVPFYIDDSAPFAVDWAHSVYKISDNLGNTAPVGTVVLINNNIMYLKSFSEYQLAELKRIVCAAVDYELELRKSNISD